MGAPRTAFRRSLDSLYDYLDNEIPLGALRSADIFWVRSTLGVDDVNHGTFDAPFATLDYAIASAVASRGTLIFVKEGHSETITGAGGITADVAGVKIIGLGRGALRPTFLMDGATTVTFAISAANVTVENLIFKGGHSDIVTCFAITAAGARIRRCSFIQNTTDENFLTCIKATSTVDNNADDLEVSNCYSEQIDVGTLEFIEINANLARGRFEGNEVSTRGTASPLILVAAGKIVTGVVIKGNSLAHAMTANELFYSNDQSTSTGVAIDNYCAHLDTTTTHDLGLESSGINIFNLWSTSSIALQGGVVPAADVNN